MQGFRESSYPSEIGGSPDGRGLGIHPIRRIYPDTMAPNCPYSGVDIPRSYGRYTEGTLSWLPTFDA